MWELGIVWLNRIKELFDERIIADYGACGKYRVAFQTWLKRVEAYPCGIIRNLSPVEEYLESIQKMHSTVKKNGIKNRMELSYELTDTKKLRRK